jgi:hypothetical protein
LFSDVRGREASAADERTNVGGAPAGDGYLTDIYWAMNEPQVPPRAGQNFLVE